MATPTIRWLLDTTILVDLLRGDREARDWIDTIPETDRAISIVTAAELLAGCRNRSEQRGVEREIELYEIVWMSEDISQSALELYKQFHLSHNIGFLDCVIAASAMINGLHLATLNLKHFTPFSGLEITRPY